MIEGHFGLAAGAKHWAPRAPLWALLTGTFLVDFIFIPLSIAGLEGATPLDPARPDVYGGSVFHAYYTHSLGGALLVALVAGLFAGRAWGQRAGVAIGAIVFSHWVLDLVVHHADLPILPGNIGGLPLLGLGLWRSPAASAVVELLLTLAGAYLYYRSAMSLPTPAGSSVSIQRRRALTASAVTAGLLLVLFVTSVLAI
ncbi:MAG: permease [Chloroflexota bacterium]|nr:permease [Chloroflexota bacterium]